MTNEEVRKDLKGDLEDLCTLLIAPVIECKSKGFSKYFFMSTCEAMWDGCPIEDRESDEKAGEKKEDRVPPITSSMTRSQYNEFMREADRYLEE